MTRFRYSEIVGVGVLLGVLFVALANPGRALDQIDLLWLNQVHTTEGGPNAAGRALGDSTSTLGLQRDAVRQAACRYGEGRIAVTFENEVIGTLAAIRQATGPCRVRYQFDPSKAAESGTGRWSASPVAVRKRGPLPAMPEGRAQPDTRQDVSRAERNDRLIGNLLLHSDEPSGHVSRQVIQIGQE